MNGASDRQISHASPRLFSNRRTRINRTGLEPKYTRLSLGKERVRRMVERSVVEPLESQLLRRQYPVTDVPTVQLVFAAYDADRSENTWRCLLAEAPLGGPSQTRAVIVANSAEAEDRLKSMTCLGRVNVIRGTNMVGEFSAYEEGLRHLEDRGPPSALVILANDRALSYGDTYGDLLRPAPLSSVAQNGIVVGNIDSYQRPIELLGEQLTTWCRSNLVVLPRVALDQVGGALQLSDEEYGRYVPEAFPGPAWLPEEWLGADYAALVMTWLTSPRAWYRASPLREESWPVVRRKLLAIVNEHVLSMRLHAAGYPLMGYRRVALMQSGLLPRQALVRQIAETRRDPFAGDDAAWGLGARTVFAARGLMRVPRDRDW